MWLSVDPRARTPIYQQIIDDIKERVARGVLPTASRLPSIRELAADLTINPNTIAKAYQELEREGVIEVIRGKGTFVSQPAGAPVQAAAWAMIRELLTKALVEAHHVGLAMADVTKELERLIGAWEQGESGS